MSDFENELLDLLEKNGKFDPAREEVLRLQVTSEFARKKKRLLIWAWVYHVVGVAIMIPGVLMTTNASRSHDVLLAVQGAVLILFALALLIVIKLWYWIVHSRLEIMRELKRLELRWTLQNRETQPKQGN